MESIQALGMQSFDGMPKEEQALRQMKALLQRVRGRLDERLEPMGVTTAQLQMLHQIAAADGEQRRVSSAGVARLCGVTPQTMQAQLVRSEKAGWVRRGVDPENERLVLWRLTARGRGLLAEAEVVFAQVIQRAWKGVPAAETRVAMRVVEQLLENLREA